MKKYKITVSATGYMRHEKIVAAKSATDARTFSHVSVSEWIELNDAGSSARGLAFISVKQA